jgi:sterol desaturase/sphingolipid hydroxylase (fatty acid hydroxylase superfamily)
MLLHPAGVAAGAGVAVFYTLFSAALQATFYWRRGGDPASWKTQPAKGLERLGRRAGVPWVPALDAVLHLDGVSRVKRAPYHWLLATINTALAALAAAVAVHLIATGRSRVYLTWPAEWSAAYCAVRLAAEVVAIVSLHQLEEYWWHRLMHTPWCYRRAHKLHHAYKAPEPFDDMYIHPAEAAGYYL